MTIVVYQIGDSVTLDALFKNLAGVATDPGTVTFRITKPNGTVVTYVYGTDIQLVKDGTGDYHVDIACDQAGQWFYRWTGTGAVAAAEDGEFMVSPN